MLERAEMGTGSMLIVCEPKPLDETSLSSFLNCYDAKISERIQAACSSRDGTYLQILIRLAMLSPDAKSVADLYRDALSALTRNEDDLIDQAGRMCLEIYWKTGTRTIPYAHEDREHRALVKRLLKTGILTADRDASKLRVDEPTIVRFRHDAFQTYLTARSVRVEREPRLLECCVGQPWFRERQSQSDALDHTELFDMCTLLLGDESRVRKWLVSRVRTLASDHGGDVKCNDLVRALPPAVQDLLGGDAASALGVAAVVEAALEQPEPSGESLSSSICATLFKCLVIGACSSLEYQRELDALMDVPLTRNSMLPGRSTMAAE